MEISQFVDLEVSKHVTAVKFCPTLAHGFPWPLKASLRLTFSKCNRYSNLPETIHLATVHHEIDGDTWNGLQSLNNFGALEFGRLDGGLDLKLCVCTMPPRYGLAMLNTETLCR